MLFSTVVEYFDRIEKVSARLEITRLLAELFKASDSDEISIVCNLALGMLRPPYQGTQFNLAEKSLRASVATFLGKDEKDILKEIHAVGDLGSVIEQLAPVQASQISVREMYNDLCILQEMSGKGSQEEKLTYLIALFKKLSPLESKYVVRIILGTLRLGFSEMTVIDALSWMETGDKSLRHRIEHAYNICVDLGLIAATLKAKGMPALDEMKIIVGIPIRPAAAERLPTAQAIFEKLGHCVAQPKLDGFRLQIHVNKKNGDIKFYSRNLLDMSYMFPDIAKEFETINVENIICEGEAIAIDIHTGTFLPFQETVKRKRKHGIEEMMSELPLRIFLFDLLHLNGIDYLNESHEKRRAALQAVFASYTGAMIHIIDEVHINSAEQLQDYFMQNLDRGLEGLVVKKENAIYQPGKRNFNWIKFKRNEEGHLEDTIDCVVLGYYAGSGKRASFGIGAFLAGVFNTEKDCFQTVAKIGTGLTDEEWKQLKQMCDQQHIDHKPINVECAKELEPDVWCSPHIVVMIRADEITMSPLHSAGKTEKKLGYALRFPRMMGQRFDKSAQEITSVDEIKRLYEDQFIK